MGYNLKNLYFKPDAVARLCWHFYNPNLKILTQINWLNSDYSHEINRHKIHKNKSQIYLKLKYLHQIPFFVLKFHTESLIHISNCHNLSNTIFTTQRIHSVTRYEGLIYKNGVWNRYQSQTTVNVIKTRKSIFFHSTSKNRHFILAVGELLLTQTIFS